MEKIVPPEPRVRLRTLVEPLPPHYESTLETIIISPPEIRFKPEKRFIPDLPIKKEPVPSPGVIEKSPETPQKVMAVKEKPRLKFDRESPPVMPVPKPLKEQLRSASKKEPEKERKIRFELKQEIIRKLVSREKKRTSPIASERPKFQAKITEIRSRLTGKLNIREIKIDRVVSVIKRRVESLSGITRPKTRERLKGIVTKVKEKSKEIRLSRKKEVLTAPTLYTVAKERVKVPLMRERLRKVGRQMREVRAKVESKSRRLDIPKIAPEILKKLRPKKIEKPKSETKLTIRSKDAGVKRPVERTAGILVSNPKQELIKTPKKPTRRLESVTRRLSEVRKRLELKDYLEKIAAAYKETEEDAKILRKLLRSTTRLKKSNEEFDITQQAPEEIRLLRDTGQFQGQNLFIYILLFNAILFELDTFLLPTGRADPFSV